MIRGRLVGLASASLVFVAACGAAGQQGQASRPTASATAERVGSEGAPPVGPADLGPQPAALTFVVRQGADPQAAARRIAGSQASARPVAAAAQEDAGRTYLVEVPAGQEADALRRARTDPAVQSASLSLKVPLPAGAGQ